MRFTLLPQLAPGRKIRKSIWSLSVDADAGDGDLGLTLVTRPNWLDRSASWILDLVDEV